MSPQKVTCPGCQKALTVAQALPANLRCPKCQTRFHAGHNGSAALHSSVASQQGAGGRVVVLAAIGGVAFLFFILGASLLAYCLLAPGTKSENDEEILAPTQRAKLPLEPVAFKKPGPRGSGSGIGSARQGKPAPDAPPGVAKDIASAAMLAPANQKEIDAAIDKGVAYLTAKLDDNGNFQGDANGNRLGGKALIGLTLLSCGVPA